MNDGQMVGYDVSYTQNRELSWLRFNQRVLEEAADTTVPLLERMKFIAIFSSNLDEFFMIRVGSLSDAAIVTPDSHDNKSYKTPKEQLQDVFTAVKPLIKLRNKLYTDVMKELEEVGLHDLTYEDLDKRERKAVHDYFRDFIRPVLSPQVVDDRHPFPHLESKKPYVVTMLTDKDGSKALGIVPIPDILPTCLTITDDPRRFLRAETVVQHNMDRLFEVYETGNSYVICVTRNADLTIDEENFGDDEEAGDFSMHMSRLLKKRDRLNPVRLEIQVPTEDTKPEKALVSALTSRLKLKNNQVFTSICPLNLDYVYHLGELLPEKIAEKLCYPPFHPRFPVDLDHDRSITEQVRERDHILFYPYDQMSPFLQLLREAADDPTVVSIKITIYRLAKNSQVVQHLINAADNGKDITVLMELRARFDEENNIYWAKQLEEAGCRIIYGMEGFKCHSKICLITRQIDNRIEQITQIGTGNYNETTAALYSDLCLLTADEEIGRDAVTFFQNMLIGNLAGTYETLLVAPSNMKRSILEHIDREIAKGPDGFIMIKANSLTERDVIDKLAEASKAGVTVRFNLRGICCLLPGIPDKTENIKVRSIVGRFLEHCRIYVFGSGDDQEVYISSADLMTRNITRRVEVACPIKDPAVKREILHYLEILFRDNVKARILRDDGSYRHVKRGADDEPFDAQDWLIHNPLQEPVTEQKAQAEESKGQPVTPGVKQAASIPSVQQAPAAAGPQQAPQAAGQRQAPQAAAGKTVVPGAQPPAGPAVTPGAQPPAGPAMSPGAQVPAGHAVTPGMQPPFAQAPAAAGPQAPAAAGPQTQVAATPAGQQTPAAAGTQEQVPAEKPKKKGFWARLFG